MLNKTRVSLVGVDPSSKIGKLFGEKFNGTKHYSQIDEAIEAHLSDPAEVWLIDSRDFSQSVLNQVSKLTNAPEAVCCAEDKIPNLVKIMAPQTIFADLDDDEIVWTVEHAAALYRKRKRLTSLRDLRKNSGTKEQNPAISLVTDIMRKCTMAEDYIDILNSVFGMHNLINFQDATILILDSENKVISSWHSSFDVKTGPASIPSAHGFDFSEILSRQSEKVLSLSSSDPGASTWSKFTQNPWTFGMAMFFGDLKAPNIAGGPRKAVFALYRRELFSFQEKDLWLYELTHGPISLALEKVLTLKAIAKASKEWRATFDSISEPLTVINSSYQIIKANKAFATLVAQDIKKIKGRRCYQLLAGRRSPCVGCPVTALNRESGGSRLQIGNKRKKDLVAWSYGIRTATEAYHFQFYRNISNETELTSTLIQSEKMVALGKLVGAVAHEINNPLAAILATSQLLLLDDGDAITSLRDDIEEINKAALRSKRIIEDLLGFTSEQDVANSSCDLAEAVKSALIFSKTALQNISISTNLPERSNKVAAHSGLVQQVVFNLVTNAAQALNQKGKIEIRVSQDEAFSNISIKDDGPGIDANRLPHIFDPFYTSKKEGGGTGLGLSIVKNLLNKVGGKIEASSELGKGTEFLITIPNFLPR